jgi:hypothetical protein
MAHMYVFKPKMQIWVNFGGTWNEKKLADVFYGYLENILHHLVYSLAIW